MNPQDPMPAPAPGGVEPKRRAGGLAGRLLDALLPRSCALCEMLLCERDSTAGFCGACRAALPGADARRCAGCGLRCPASCCGACATVGRRPSTLVCCDYAAPVDRLVGAFKYGRRIALGQAIGDAMAERLSGAGVLANMGSAPLLLPIPASPARLAARGFNQAGILAGVVARRCGCPVGWEMLTRSVETRPQPGLARGQRRDNLRGAMRAGSGLDGREVIVVDDVITSGATFEEAERAVRLAGARSVLRLAFARTPAPG